MLLETLCQDESHCGTCRDRDGGRRWRASLAALFPLPVDAPDFECPHGLPWEYKGAGEGAKGVKSAKSAKARETKADPRMIAARLALCRTCDEYNGNVCERQFSCGVCLGTFRRWLGDAASVCPLPEPRWEAEVRTCEGARA